MTKRKSSLTGMFEAPKQKQARPPVAQYYLPVEIRDAVKAQARPVKASVSGFCAALLVHALNDYQTGKIDLSEFLIDESKSPRYFYSWDYAKIIESMESQD